MANVHFMFILATGETKRLKDGTLSNESLELRIGDILVWLNMDDTQKRVKFPGKSPFSELGLQLKDFVLKKGKPAKVTKVRDNAVPPHKQEDFPYTITVEGNAKAEPLVGPEIIVDGGDGLLKKPTKKTTRPKAKR